MRSMRRNWARRLSVAKERACRAYGSISAMLSPLAGISAAISAMVALQLPGTMWVRSSWDAVRYRRARMFSSSRSARMTVVNASAIDSFVPFVPLPVVPVVPVGTRAAFLAHTADP